MSKAITHLYVASGSAKQTNEERGLIYTGLAFWLAGLVVTGFVVYLGLGLAESGQAVM